MPNELGTNYKVTVPVLADNASIYEAFQYYHMGAINGSVATNSMENRLLQIDNKINDVVTNIGYSGISPTPPPLQTRLGYIETVVGTSSNPGGSNSSSYIKMGPSSNDTASTRNLITPTGTSIIPLTIQGINGQSGDLQQWKTNAATVAKVDSTGKLSSYNGSSMVDVVTVSGAQTLTDKTLTTPISTIGTNARTASYTLVLSDQSKMIEINSSSATTLTIPADASVNFPIGTYIVVLQTGSGQITINGSGFTPNATPGRKTRTLWAMATLIKRGRNLWVIAGDLVA
jgi:aspartate 1-decarboxylase